MVGVVSSIPTGTNFFFFCWIFNNVWNEKDYSLIPKPYLAMAAGNDLLDNDHYS